MNRCLRIFTVTIFVLLAVWPLVNQGAVESAEMPGSELHAAVSFSPSTLPLDLSRAPTSMELMAAGQLGGPLYPTHVLKDKPREQLANWSFGQAIQEWNQHRYPLAVKMFRKHLEDFPDSPWAAEAALHIGCDATYNGRYTEAEAVFSQLISSHRSKPMLGASMLVNKARQRLALLKIEQNNLDEANALFGDLLHDSADWRHRTYASHWIQTISRFQAAKQALLTCGAEALAYALEKEGRVNEASQVRTNVPATMRGHSLANLVQISADHGFALTAIHIKPDDITAIPLPAILHIIPKHRGDRGHFWVLDKIQGASLEIYDSQSQHRFRQSIEDLKQEWTGITLIFHKGGPLPGEKLDAGVMEELTGGCCGAPRPPSGTGNPGNNGEGGSGGGGNGCGAPTWLVNVINMNLFVTDTPLWYDPPVGPSIRITLSYNSQSSITYHEPFGNKWQFNYGSYLVVDTAGSVLIFMPDGRYDVFSPDGTGGYRRPYQVFSTLTKIAENYFELRFLDDTVYVYRIPPGTSSQQVFLTEIRDAYGQHLAFGYDSNVHLTTITDAQGKIFTLSYNASGLCTKVADPFGRSATFAYDSQRNLTSIVDMGEYGSSFTYDNNVYLTSIANSLGKWDFRIEPADGVANGSNPYPPPGGTMWENYRITVTNPLGQTEQFHYNGYSSYSWYVSPRDFVPWRSQYENTYDLNAPRTRYDFASTGSGQRGEIGKIVYPEGDTVQYGYDSATGNRTSITDAHSHTWRYAYNSMGRVTSVTDAKGTPTAFIYATNGVDLLSVSNGLGQIRMTYNAQHDILSLTDRLSNTTSFNYNANGQILSQVDALGATNEYLYDANQRLAEFRRAGQILERFTYDAMGRVRTRTDATGLTVSNDYNGLNQVTRVTYPDGHFESYDYSTCCPRLLDSVVDRGGRTNLFFYDAAKRLILSVNPEGGVTQFGYDANGNRTSLTDPNGNATTFAYNLDDRLIRKTYADGKGLSFRYDQAGLLTTRTNGRGITTSYAYDANHNLVTTRYSDGTPGVTNTYDAFNRLTVVKDGVGTNAYAYDANSRLASFDGPWTDDTITYAFDALGRRTNLLVQGSQPTGYDYDALNRLKNVRVGAQAYAYTYAGASPLVQRLDRPNGSFTAYQFDGLNRLTSLSNRRSTGQVINEFLYAYNAQDLRASETVSNGLALTFTNQQVIYDYNRLNQLLTSAPPSQLFAYDEDGNMTRGFTPEGLPFVATCDAENRLNSVVYTNGSGVVCSNRYVYRGNSFLAQVKEFQNGALSNDTRNVRTDYLPLQERSPANSVTREYAWGVELGGGIGGLLNLKQSGQDYSYVYDGKGNVMALLDNTQITVVSYAYDAFGNLIATAGPLNQPFQFSTKSYDERTGLSYYGYRFYSPVLGSWTTRDPLSGIEGPNDYAFVGNNPIKWADAYGLYSAQAWREGLRDLFNLDTATDWYGDTWKLNWFGGHIGGGKIIGPGEKGAEDVLPVNWLDWWAKQHDRWRCEAGQNFWAGRGADIRVFYEVANEGLLRLLHLNPLWDDRVYGPYIPRPTSPYAPWDQQK
jgi:RHS repeat-associated protein